MFRNAPYKLTYGQEENSPNQRELYVEGVRWPAGGKMILPLQKWVASIFPTPFPFVSNHSQSLFSEDPNKSFRPQAKFILQLSNET